MNLSRLLLAPMILAHYPELVHVRLKSIVEFDISIMGGFIGAADHGAHLPELIPALSS